MAPGPRPASKRALARQRFAEYERVDLVGTFIGEDALEIEHVADDRVLEQNAVGAQEVTAGAGDFERNGDVVALAERDLLGRDGAVLFFETRVVISHQVGLDDLLATVD